MVDDSNEEPLSDESISRFLENLELNIEASRDSDKDAEIRKGALRRPTSFGTHFEQASIQVTRELLYEVIVDPAQFTEAHTPDEDSEMGSTQTHFPSFDSPDDWSSGLDTDWTLMKRVVRAKVREAHFQTVGSLEVQEVMVSIVNCQTVDIAEGKGLKEFLLFEVSVRPFVGNIVLKERL